MKKWCCLLIAVMLSVNLFGQSGNVTAVPELIANLNVGEGKTEIQYSVNDEGFYSPGPPLIDNGGKIWFFPNLKDEVLVLSGGLINSLAFPQGSKKPRYPQSFPGISQQGMFGYSWHPNDLEYKLRMQSSTKGEAGTDYYLMPWGYIAVFKGFNNKMDYGSIEYIPMSFSMSEKVSRQYKFRNFEETRSWLSTKNDDFLFGDDGLLYKNGIPYSAIKPDILSFDHYYIGRLITGHIVWASGGFKGSDRYFTVTNMAGNVEAILELPWAPVPGSGPQFFNYGLGPWGELYCLLPPSNRPETKMEKIFDPDPSKPAELVVVRNHLKYFGRLNDGGVRLRKESNTTSEIIGTYPAKTGFRILEKGEKEETIGGQKNVWYKVRLLDGKEGWFFGSFVHNLYDGPNGKAPPWPNVADW